MSRSLRALPRHVAESLALLHDHSPALPIEQVAMSFIGGGIEASLAQLAHVQQAAAEGKDRERAASESARRTSDSVLLRVAGLEHPGAARKADNDDLEQGKHKRRRKQKEDDEADGKEPEHPIIDVRA